MNKHEKRLIKDLVPYDRNPRQNDGRAVDEVLESLKRHGQVKPIVVSAKGHPFDKEIICCGHTTLKALQKFGAKECTVVVHEFKDEAEFVDYNVRDNQSATFSMWDNGKLVELSQDFDLDLKGMGFDMESITGEDDKEIVEDEVPEPPIEPITKPGDLWLLGDHRLLCGDSTKAEDVDRLMDGKKVDMLLSDPPYGVSYVGKTKDAMEIENDSLDENGLSELIVAAFDGAQRISRDGAYWYATVPAGPLHILFVDDWKKRGILRQIMVWAKDSMVLGHSEYHYQHEPILFGWMPGDRHKNSDRTRTTLWKYDRPKANREHPTMKPIELWAQAVRDGSREGEKIYDPFLGSGTTLIAAEQLGRKCYGMEISPAYCDVIVKRWETLTGKKATKA